MHTYECETCDKTVEIEHIEAAFGSHEHYEQGQCLECFNKTLEEPIDHSKKFCKHCGCELEAEFVDIGIGKIQVTDLECQNPQCPEHLEWLENHLKNIKRIK